MDSKFVVLMEWVENIEDLNLSQKGKLFQAFIDFNKTGKVEIKDKMVKVMWGFIEPNIIRMNQKYQKDVENGKKGGRPKKIITQPKPPINPPITPKNLNETYKDKDKHKHKHKEKENHKHKEEIKVKREISNTGTDISSGTYENPHSRFLEPNDCIEKLLNEKLTKQSN